MNLSPEEQEVGKENFYAAIGSKPIRRDFLLAGVRDGIASRKGMGPYYFGYGKSVNEPVRVGVIGTGDEGGVLIGALNPAFIEVKAICDIRPYNRFRAFHGEIGQAARPGLMSVYGWKNESEARRHVRVYEGSYQELIDNAKKDGIEAVILALPLHLHAPAAIAAMRAGLHVITEKLMGHSVRDCKEMARVAEHEKRYLAVGHQRHYSILYNNAVELIKKGVLGNLHYIRAQWHRGNLPGHDSWQQPLPPGVKDEHATQELVHRLEHYKHDLDSASGKELDLCRQHVHQLEAQIADAVLNEKKGPGDKTLAETLGYESRQITTSAGTYDRPAIEELIRWRLWDRTGAGLMAELGSHQLDAASIFIAAAHGGKMQHPLSVAAAGNRPLFPPDRDIEDHVFCIFEFPAPGYDPNDPLQSHKKIGVQYASINGNGFGGYGETVFGTDGTLLLETEKDVLLYKVADTKGKTRVVESKKKGAALEVSGSGDESAAALGRMAMLAAERGYAEELEHWAWCIRNPSPEHLPRCHPAVALKDAVIALTANKAAREGRRIEFKESWFDFHNDETPDQG
jgi:predicted dehydrogenase